MKFLCSLQADLNPSVLIKLTEDDLSIDEIDNSVYEYIAEKYIEENELKIDSDFFRVYVQPLDGQGHSVLEKKCVKVRVSIPITFWSDVEE